METQKTSGLNETNDAVEAANKATWEDLNPDWLGDGDLTKRFAKSQFDTCPGCGKFEQLKVYNMSGDDQSASVLCLPCQWQVNGETPSEAIENWNRRCAGLRHAGEWVAVSDRMKDVALQIEELLLEGSEPAALERTGELRALLDGETGDESGHQPQEDE